jgi:hypothetical protein
MSYPYIIQGNNITVVIGSTPFTISKTHITYSQVLEAIKAGEWDRVKEIVDPVKVVLSFGQGNVTIEGEKLLWKGRELNTGLAARMITMLQEGFDIKPMASFMENLMSNPSKRAVDELYGFLEKNNLPITPDGHFLAYKRVRDNYFDVHSGTMDNSVGKIVEMERNEVDDDKDRTCSAGLHFCSHSYLGHFGGDRVVIVKINPADVVSIPSDYNDSKGRACRYEVIGEVDNNPDDGTEFTKPVQSNANSVTTDNTWEWDADGIDDDFVDDSWIDDCDDEEDEDDIVVEDTSSTDLNEEFVRGYDDGYNYRVYRPVFDHSPNQNFYLSGYDQGVSDADMGKNAAHFYVPDAPSVTITSPSGWTHTDGKISPPPGTVFAAQAAWPFPKS